MEMIGYSSHYLEINMHLVLQNMIGRFIFYVLTYLTSSVKFCVDEVFKIEGRQRYEMNKEWQDPKLGDAQGTPR